MPLGQIWLIDYIFQIWFYLSSDQGINCQIIPYSPFGCIKGSYNRKIIQQNITLSSIGRLYLLASLLANPVHVYKLLSLGSASFPSDCVHNSLTARSRTPVLDRFGDAGVVCWGWRMLASGLGSRKFGFNLLASNLIQLAIPMLFFLISDLIGLFFLLFVVVGCCCCC